MSSSGSSRFLSAYYVGNVLVLASYALLRPLAEPATRVGLQSKLASYEQQAAVTLLASFGLKVMRVHSPDHLASLMFMYAKAGGVAAERPSRAHAPPPGCTSRALLLCLSADACHHNARSDRRVTRQA